MNLRLASTLLIVGFTPIHSRGDQRAAGTPFQVRELSVEERTKVVGRARCLRQQSKDRPQLDAQTILGLGAAPRFELKVDDATFYLTPPFSFFGGRQIALAFVDVDNAIYTRVLYRSNSQFSWRVCDATSGRHIGKGFHEFDKQLPIPVTVALLKMHDQEATLNAGEDEQLSQSELSQQLLRGLTEDGIAGLKSGRVIRTPQRKYFSREYAAHIASEPMTFSRVEGWLKTAGDLRVADLDHVALPPKDELPNLSIPIAEFRFTSPAYAELNDGDGELIGKVFLSHDKRIRYLFFEDSDGRVVMSGAEALTAEINVFGLRSRYLETAGMDAPLMEYRMQIPEQFGGKKESGVASNWPYVRRQPIIQYYYRTLGRQPPGQLAEVGSP